MVIFSSLLARTETLCCDRERQAIGSEHLSATKVPFGRQSWTKGIFCSKLDWILISRSCSRAATGSADFEAKIWCALTGDEMHSFQHNHIVRSVDFAPDGNKLLTGGQEKKIRLFDLENRNSEPLTLTGHDGTVKRCLFVDQNTIMTIGDDKTFRQWDLR